MIKPSNFSFLAGQERLLYEIASSAENAFTKDPNATLVRLRQLAEHLVRNLAAQVGIQPAPELKLVDLIVSITPKLGLDGKIVKLLHHLRVQGNSAAHEYRQDHRDAADAMRSARELCIWYYRTFCNPRPDFKPGPFVHPRNWQSEEASLEREVERLQSLLTGEIEHSSAKNDLIRQLEIERERLAALAEERTRDAEASFSLAEEQCRHAEELRADYESRLRRLAEERAAQPFDTVQYAERSYDATQKTAAHWVPEVTLTQFLADEELTPDQSRLATCLGDFLSDSGTGVFLMTGAAGTGKTFMTKGLTNFLSTCGRRSVLIAPTGKAARVLGGKAGSPAATIHSAIYSTKDVKEYNVEDVQGTETFKFYYDLRANDDADNTVYIVDEASMVSDVYSEGEFFRFGSGRLLSDLMRYVNLDHNDHSKKIIFIGDPAQLPPVGMASSPALDGAYLKKTFAISAPAGFELRDVVRQSADSNVLHAANNIRRSIEKKVFSRLQFSEAEDLACVTNHSELLDHYLSACDGRVSDQAMILAWSNAAVAGFNELVRSKLFPDTLAVAQGDKLVAVMNSLVDGISVNNGDLLYALKVESEAEVREITLKTKHADSGRVEERCVELRFRDVTVGFRGPSGTATRLRAKILENLLYNAQPSLSSDENKALYIDFRIRHPHLPTKGKFLGDALRADPYFNALRVKFGYALTCHKAQGSEWPTVIVDCRHNGQNPSSEIYFRWLYTAVTRAKQKLYLLHAPRLRLSDALQMAPKDELQVETESRPTDSTSAGVGPESCLSPRPANDSDDLHGRIYAAVAALLASRDSLRIDRVEHHPYLEAFLLSDGARTGRVNVSYNKKGAVTAIAAAPLSAIGTEATTLLAPLKGRTFSAPAGGAGLPEAFTHEVFNEFLPAFNACASRNGLNVLSAREEGWSLRLMLANASAAAEVSFYCDAKGRLKPPAWLGNSPVDRDLLVSFRATLECLEI